MSQSSSSDIIDKLSLLTPIAIFLILAFEVFKLCFLLKASLLKDRDFKSLIELEGIELYSPHFVISSLAAEKSLYFARFYLYISYYFS
jgi:hypothetical protein